MNREVLLERVKQAIYKVEPNAKIILYGSRAREDYVHESDWDFLVLVDGPVDDERTDRIRHRLYEIEWDCGEILCSIIRNRRDWDSTLFRSVPLHQIVEREGIAL